jgi:tetratricopeptide (TPR) repeat protein
MKWFRNTFPAIILLSSMTAYAGLNEDIASLQTQWATTNYELSDKAQIQSFESLIVQADQLVERFPNNAEPYIWRGIIKSSFAGAKGGLGAMSLAKASKLDLEKALTLDETALSGSAFTSLGTLYFKVPGWPIGFGDDEKAKSLLNKAITLNPEGIDSNYFYAQFLMDQGDYQQAETYLLKAQSAAPRPNRPIADKGRQEEITKALYEIKAQLKKKPTGMGGVVN